MIPKKIKYPKKKKFNKIYKKINNIYKINRKNKKIKRTN